MLKALFKIYFHLSIISGLIWCASIHDNQSFDAHNIIDTVATEIGRLQHSHEFQIRALKEIASKCDGSVCAAIFEKVKVISLLLYF